MIPQTSFPEQIKLPRATKAKSKKGTMSLQQVRTAGDVGLIEVDNPAEFAERVIHPKIWVSRSLRDDPLGQMHDRHQVSEAEYKAGRQWQREYEAAGARIKSSGFLQEPVDGGGSLKEGVTDRQMIAHRALSGYAAQLGPEGNRIVHWVLADKLTLREVANRRHYDTSRSTMMYVGRRWRECLGTLAVCMGYAS